MPSQKPFFIIINPVAGGGRALRQWHTWQQKMEAAGLSIKTVFTKKQGDGKLLARKALADGFLQLVVAGGDGTLNEVLNGCFENGKLLHPDITLGMIPLGTGNDWVKTHSITSAKCLQTLSEKQKVPHDVGVLRFWQQGHMQERLFLNIASFGFAGTVVKKKEEKNGKLRWDLGQYVVALLQALSSQKPFQGTIALDSQVISDSFFNISVGNGQYFGGGMKILPQAQFQDGLLHISIVREIGKLKVALNIPNLFRGTYIHNREVTLTKSKSITLTFENPVYCEAEGELVALADTFELGILERGLHVFSQSS